MTIGEFNLTHDNKSVVSDIGYQKQEGHDHKRRFVVETNKEGALTINYRMTSLWERILALFNIGGASLHNVVTALHKYQKIDLFLMELQNSSSSRLQKLGEKVHQISEDLFRQTSPLKPTKTRSFHGEILDILQDAKLGLWRDKPALESYQKHAASEVREGVCHGISCMAIQAILVGRFEQFAARIRSLLNDPSTSRNEEAFLSGILIAQNPSQYPELFDEKTHLRQDPKVSFPVIASRSLEKLGGAKTFLETTGMYTIKDFKSYLDAVEKVFFGSENPLDTPLGMLISSQDHAIAVGYDPKTKEWFFIDANQLPAQRLSSTEELQRCIDLAYPPSKDYASSPYLNLSVSFQTTKEPHEDLIRQFKDLIQPIQEMTVERVNAKCRSSGYSWLHGAIGINDIEAIENLLDNGANINQMTNQGMTPLLRAMTMGDRPMAQVLLERGSNPDQVLPNGMTPLIMAISHKSTDMVECLLQQKANPSQTLLNGMSPLIMAVSHDDRSLVQSLLNHGADVNHCLGESKVSALWFAAGLGKREIVELLLNHPTIDIELEDTNGLTPLAIATQENYPDVVEVLLKKGAKRDLKIGDQSLLEYAKNEGFEKVAALLAEEEVAK